jgi:hypothetical protein
VVSRSARGYGLANLLFALFYLWLVHAVVPPRSSLLAWTLDAVSGLFGASGVALIVDWKGARAIATVACALVLLVACAALAALVGAQAFLTAIYGSLGQGGWVVSFLAAALVVQFFVLLPVLELRAFRLNRYNRQ